MLGVWMWPELIYYSLLSDIFWRGIVLIVVQYILDKIFLKVTLTKGSLKKLFFVDLVHYALVTMLIMLCSQSTVVGDIANFDIYKILIRFYFYGFSCIPMYYVYLIIPFDGLEEQPLKAAIINVLVTLISSFISV